MSKVLVLNASYEPLNITSWRRAIVLLLKENLVAACVRCNVHKGNRTPKEANMSLRAQPRRPYSSLHFELLKHTRENHNQEWRKYVIGI